MRAPRCLGWQSRQRRHWQLIRSHFSAALQARTPISLLPTSISVSNYHLDHLQYLETEAIQIMREKKVSCIPIVEEGKLVGVVTEYDLIKIASHLLEDMLTDYGSENNKT